MGELGSIVPDAGLIEPGRHPVHLHIAPQVIAAEHVQHHKVIHAVPIDVGGVHPHREGAGVPQGQLGRSPKSQGATRSRFIDPESVFRLEIIANVQVWAPIASEIPEQDAQPPILRRRIERTTRGVQESPARPWHLREPPFAIIEIQGIHLAIFPGAHWSHGEPPHQIGFIGRTAIVGHDSLSPVLFAKGILGLGIITHRHRAVVGDVQIQIPVSIGIRQ